MTTAAKRVFDVGLKVYARLQACSSMEYEQALIRLLIALIVWCYLFFWWNDLYGLPAHELLSAATVFVVIALGLVVTVMRYPGHYTARRLLGNGVDIAVISYALYAVESHTIVLVAAYLWVILGNGFRYGTGYLWWTMGLALCGFVVATVCSKGWSIPSIPWFNALIVLVVLPLYCQRFITIWRDVLRQAQDNSHAHQLFMASVSHDMRTPLANMSSLTTLLRCTPITPEQAHYLNRVAVATTTLQLLIDQVVDTALSEQGQLRIQKHDFDPHITLEKLTDIIGLQARDNNLEFKVTRTPLPRTLFGDECRLMQILMNMLSNALRYTPQGYIHLNVEATPNSAGHVDMVFTITDSGIGMSEEFLKIFFRPFKREHRSQTTPGCGLGASITRQWVERMGGTIDVRSQIDQGTTITIHLAFEYPDHDPIKLACGRLRMMRVVLIGQNVDTVRAHLQQWGMVVECIDTDRAYYARYPSAPEFAAAEAIIVESAALTQGLAHLSGYLQHHARSTRIIVLDQHHVSSPTMYNPHLSAQLAAQDIPALCNALLDIRLHPPTAHGNPQHLFVAEDNATFRMYLQTLLNGAGYTVTCAENGSRAIELLKQRIDYDAYFLDMCMPGHTGVEVFQFLCSQHPGRPRVFALTAASHEDMRQRCEQLGFTQFLSKPISIEQILTALKGDGNTPRFEHRGCGEIPPSSTALLNPSGLDSCRQFGEPFLRKLIESFRRQSQTLLTEIEHTDCPLTFYKHVHALKSCAASVSAPYMVHTLTLILKTQVQVTQITAYHRQLRQVTEDTYAALQHYLEHDLPSSCPSVDGSQNGAYQPKPVSCEKFR